MAASGGVGAVSMVKHLRKLFPTANVGKAYPPAPRLCQCDCAKQCKVYIRHGHSDDDIGVPSLQICCACKSIREGEDEYGDSDWKKITNDCNCIFSDSVANVFPRQNPSYHQHQIEAYTLLGTKVSEMFTYLGPSCGEGGDAALLRRPEFTHTKKLASMMDSERAVDSCMIDCLNSGANTENKENMLPCVGVTVTDDNSCTVHFMRMDGIKAIEMADTKPTYGCYRRNSVNDFKMYDHFCLN